MRPVSASSTSSASRPGPVHTCSAASSPKPPEKTDRRCHSRRSFVGAEVVAPATATPPARRAGCGRPGSGRRSGRGRLPPQPAHHALRGHRRETCGRELERQRQALELGAELGDRPGAGLGHLEVRATPRRPGRGTGVRRRSGRARRARRPGRVPGTARGGTSYTCSPDTPSVWRLVASTVRRGHRSSSVDTSEAQASTTCSQLSSTSSASRSPEQPGERVDRGLVGLDRETEGLDDLEPDEERVRDVAEPHDPAGLEERLGRVDRAARDLGRQPGLAGPADAGERDDARRDEELPHGCDLTPPSDERSGLDGGGCHCARSLVSDLSGYH